MIANCFFKQKIKSHLQQKKMELREVTIHPLPPECFTLAHTHVLVDFKNFDSTIFEALVSRSLIDQLEVSVERTMYYDEFQLIPGGAVFYEIFYFE